MKTKDVKFRQDLYPRIEKNPLTVQKYSEDLEVLPPIEVNQNNELIDGWHRWTAHVKMNAYEIPATVTETTSDAHLLELAIERNASHGLQLSSEDKEALARKIYHSTPYKDRVEKKRQLAKILSVSERLVNGWLSRIDKDTKEARNKRIFKLWLSCHTQEEIGEIEGIDTHTVRDILGEFAELPKPLKPAADHLTDFTPPIYNIWKFQEKSQGARHFGNTEATILDNLLYLYTKPFDIVIDPFAGGGSTIDICRKRFRRYFVSDRLPIPERKEEIREHDITTGLPKPPQWKDVSLVYLDPPYWKQAEGKYSEDPEDLANMDKEVFHKTVADIIKAFSKKLQPGSHIALIIQPTQWKAPEREYTDHVFEIAKAIPLKTETRISCPYESQQCNAQMVDWAKENKTLLVLTRELVVWRV